MGYDYLAVSAEVRAALTALCTEYVWLIDNGHAARVTALFAEDGAWEGPWGVMRGREEFERAWTERATRTVRTRHMLANLRFAQSEPDRATGQISFMLYRADGDDPMRPVAELLGEHLDDYIRGPDGIWRFLSRQVALVAQP